MAEYIDKEKLLNDIECIDVIGCMDFDDLFIEVERIIKNQPTADVAEVKHGKWLKNSNETECAGYTFECSECGNLYFGVHKRNYCSKCGAKMDKECEQE